MQFNIKSQVKKLSNRIDLFSVISEAVVNSIQANATKIDIIFDSEKQNNLLSEIEEQPPLIKELKIIDNGDGFNDINIKSFCTYGSDLKESLGCKGIGRLCFLKIFNKVDVVSLIKKNNQKISFNFSDEFTEGLIKKETENSIDGNKTTISFGNIKDSYKRALDISYYKERLYHHILPLLYLRKDTQKIEINFIHNQNKDDNSSIKTEDLPAFETKRFEIQEHQTNDKSKIAFVLHYSFVESTKSDGLLNDYYCANDRAVCKFKDKELKITPLQKNKTTFLLTSAFLDKAVNDERNDFTIYPKQVDLMHHLSWEQINIALKKEIKDILYKKFPDLETENKKITKAIKEENLHLIDYLQDIDSLGGLVNSESIIEKAELLFLKDKSDFRKELKKTSNKDSQEVIRKASDLAGKELIEYVLTRDKIIDQLGILDLKKEKDEEIVRNHFLQRGKVGTDYSPIPAKENRLWLLDDKFMTYNYVASEKAINTLLDSIGLNKTDSLDRFDIGIYSNSNSSETKKVILIEMKKLSANYKENGEGINQLRNL